LFSPAYIAEPALFCATADVVAAADGLAAVVLHQQQLLMLLLAVLNGVMNGQ
jgi:hypothetical protein